MNYATVGDLITYWRPLTENETNMAETLIADVSSKIRLRAKRIGMDFDERVLGDADLAAVTKSIVCKSVSNAMKQSDMIPFSQYSETAGGMTMSGTFVNHGGGIVLSKGDWKELGILRQTFGAVDIYGTEDKKC